MIKHLTIDTKEVETAFKKLGKVSQRPITKAAKKGTNILYKEVKNRVPVDTGVLKKGIIIKAEKSKKRAKKVFQVTFNPAMNDMFVSVSKKGKRGYYPASQEFGFKARNGKYIPGYNYMSGTVKDKNAKVREVIIKTLMNEIEKALR